MFDILFFITLLMFGFSIGANIALFQKLEERGTELSHLESALYNAEIRIKTEKEISKNLREELRTLRYDPANGKEIVIGANPQHFRPMFDSQGTLFNATEPANDTEPVSLTFSPKNDIMFFPETYEEEYIGQATEPDGNDTGTGESTEGQSGGPEPVPSEEGSTTGVVRSGSVS